MTKACGMCRFWVRNERAKNAKGEPTGDLPQRGVCRVGPRVPARMMEERQVMTPEGVVTQRVPAMYFMLPEMGADEWCGKFKPRGESKPPQKSK